jgi:eukaryotic-like serine/threonine-protein kinase
MGSPVGSLIPPGARAFGKYELVAKLATGGMAEIFLARMASGAEKLLVIKRVLPHLAEDERFISMFRDEARLASRIEHPNVCKVFELGRVGGTYFISMEYLHGVPVSRVLLKAARLEKPLDLRIVAAMIHQCCAGLHHAHELTSLDGKPLDVVHRDVSPPNIFATEEGVMKLLDFGVAKARGASQKTRTGTVKGKNSYMSPEQILGKEVDRRSDIFSLGIVMWESITASRLFSRDTDFLTFRAITEADIPDLSERRKGVPDELRRVLDRALTRECDERFRTAKEFGEALTEAMKDHGGVATVKELAAFVKTQFSRELESKARLFLDADRGGATGDGASSFDAPTTNLPTPVPSVEIPRAVTAGGSREIPALDVDEPAGDSMPSIEVDAAALEGGPVQTTAPPPAPPRAGDFARREESVTPLAAEIEISPPPTFFERVRNADRKQILAASAGMVGLLLLIVLFVARGGTSADAVGTDTEAAARPGSERVAAATGEVEPKAPEPGAISGDGDGADRGTDLAIGGQAAGVDATGDAPASDPPKPPQPETGQRGQRGESGEAGQGGETGHSGEPGEPDDSPDPAPETDSAADPGAAGKPAEPQVDARPGFLSIDSRPWAQIYVDGRNLGETPIFRAQLAPGRYRVRAVSATGDARRFTVTIRPGRTTTVPRLAWD